MEQEAVVVGRVVVVVAASEALADDGAAPLDAEDLDGHDEPAQKEDGRVRHVGEHAPERF